MLMDWFWWLTDLVAYRGREVFIVTTTYTALKASFFWLISSSIIYLGFKFLRWIILSPPGQLLGELIVSAVMHVLIFGLLIAVLVSWLIFAVCCLTLRGITGVLAFIGISLALIWIIYWIYQDNTRSRHYPPYY